MGIAYDTGGDYCICLTAFCPSLAEVGWRCPECHRLHPDLTTHGAALLREAYR